MGDLLQRIDPFTSGLRYLDKLIVDGHSPWQDLGLLVSPLVAAVVFPIVAVATSGGLAPFPKERP